MKKLLQLAVVAAAAFYLNRQPVEVATEFVESNSTQAPVAGGNM